MLFNETNIKAQFETRRPALIEGYTRQVTATFRQAVAVLGTTLGEWIDARKHIENDGYDLSIAMMPYVIKPDTREVRWNSKEWRGTRVFIDTEKIAKEGDERATGIIDALTLKVLNKVGDLDDAKLKFIDGVDFVLTGTRWGHKIEIRQNTIWNYSVRGNIYTQYPARIYVGGAFHSAKKYKALEWAHKTHITIAEPNQEQPVVEETTQEDTQADTEEVQMLTTLNASKLNPLCREEAQSFTKKAATTTDLQELIRIARSLDFMITIRFHGYISLNTNTGKVLTEAQFKALNGKEHIQQVAFDKWEGAYSRCSAFVYSVPTKYPRTKVQIMNVHEQLNSKISAGGFSKSGIWVDPDNCWHDVEEDTHIFSVDFFTSRPFAASDIDIDDWIAETVQAK